MPTPGPSSEPTPIETRSAGFAIISRLNRWLIASAVAAAGTLSLVAHSSFHGKPKLAAAASGTSGVRKRPSATTPARVRTSPSIQSAPAPVAPAPVVAGPAPVVSGGS